jgi:hypothetical protein
MAWRLRDMRLPNSRLVMAVGLLNIIVVAAAVLLIGKMVRDHTTLVSVAEAPAPTSLKLPVPVPAR